MWRAYGAATGIALVVNTDPFFRPSDALKIYSSPVAYLDDKAFQLELDRLASCIGSNADFFRDQGKEALTAYVFDTFKFASLCTKHPGFREEREWRVVYTHTLYKSMHLIKETQVIGETPQPIYKIPLKNVPEEGLFGIAIPELLERIIIGPTD